MAAARKGTVVDQRYRLKEKIGSGGMADVWLAADRDLDRDVAVKILHDRFAQDKEFVERFRREAQSAAGLQHPNVVSIFDRGEFGDTYFIAMEYVDGPQLKDLVKGGMSTKEAIDFTRQILNAARFAHRKGIVHRDLKPQNVLIDDEGRARVADFGIARGESSDITATGSVMGTAQYLSPEQAQGKETTPRSDIYSIGVILYEALTGRVPFQGDSAVAVALKQVSETPRRPSAINPDVPPALDAVVMRALAKDPEARFKDADAFLKALDAAEKAPDQPRPEDTAAFAAVTPEGERTDLREGRAGGVRGLRGAASPRPRPLDPDRPAGRGGRGAGRLRPHPARPGRRPERDQPGGRHRYRAARGQGLRRRHQAGAERRSPRHGHRAGPDPGREGRRGLDRDPDDQLRARFGGRSPTSRGSPRPTPPSASRTSGCWSTRSSASPTRFRRVG